MNDIIREIEKAQLKPDITEFGVGDTVKVFAQENVSRYLKELYLKDRMVEPGKHLQ